MITMEALKKKVTELALDTPEFVYPDTTCTYVSADGTTGSCIFGQALNLLGIPIDILKGFDGAGVNDDVVLSITAVLQSLVDDGLMAPITPVEFVWASDVQSEQDTCTPWGSLPI